MNRKFLFHSIKGRHWKIVFHVLAIALLLPLLQNCSNGFPNGTDSGSISNSSQSGANHAPEAKSYDLNVFELIDTHDFLPGVDIDGDALTFEILTQPKSGAMSNFNPKTGEFNYSPNFGSAGTDYFTYTVSDGNLKSTTEGKVNIQISKFSFFGSDRIYQTSNVLNNGGSCGSLSFRMYSLGSNIEVEGRTISCGNTTYHVQPISATSDSQGNIFVSGKKVGTITNELMQITQSTYVSGCGTVTDNLTMSSQPGKIHYSEVLSTTCGYGANLQADLTPGKLPLALIVENNYVDLGMIRQGTATEQTIKIKNLSGGFASNLILQQGQLFSFKGGVFPGIGGTCTSALKSLESCSLVVTYTPYQIIPIYETLLLKYSDGTDTFTASITFQGLVKPNLVNPTQLSAQSLNHGCVLDSGKVVCWGLNQAGENNVPLLNNPTTVAAGINISCSTSDGKMNCWGAADSMKSKNGTAAVSIATSGITACSFDTSSLQCWGQNVSSTSPLAKVPTITNPKQVAVGYFHACVLDDSGVKCWGENNTYGQLTVPTLTSPSQVSVGSYHSCALDSGTVKCWGNNSYNVLNVPALTNPRILSTSAQHNCVLDDIGVKCWGDAVGSRPVPALTNVTHLSTGPDGTCAIANNEIFCW